MNPDLYFHTRSNIFFLNLLKSKILSIHISFMSILIRIQGLFFVAQIKASLVNHHLYD